MKVGPVDLSPREIALTGMKAQRTRMNVVANNIANAFTTRMPDGEPFRRQIPIFRGEQVLPRADTSRFGVRVPRVEADGISPLRTVYEPGHPDANEDGYVTYPNVDLAVEMVNLLAAQRAYEANIAVVQSGGQMHQRALEILQT